MHELTVFLSDEDRLGIGAELEKLYALQDRQLPKEKKALLVHEIVSMGYPLPNILGGLAKLMTEDLKVIKLATIQKAIEETTEVEKLAVVACDDCGGQGTVSMRDEAKYSFAMACRCANGRRFSGLKIWNGERNQFSNGRMLVRVGFDDIIPF